ncbi:MAG TPA: type II secretion system major pseudopilin GspG [Phycisphaerae bacterium]|nr:type II secretion system major pseudopilin GspG [Phycisphaerae bacterium]
MVSATSTKVVRIRSRRVRKGFTLLEILLVVGLLALLAAFVVPALVGQAEGAKLDLARAAIGPNGPLSGAINLYKFNTGQYPSDLKYLYEEPPDDDLKKKWKQGIQDPGGLKDPWDRDYQFRAPGEKNQKSFDLWSMGPDGLDGTEDDITNWKRDTD